MADVREIYGADSWQREHFDLLAEEAARIAHAALTSNMMFAIPVQVTETSQDGHNAAVQPTVKRATIDPVTGEKSYEAIPVHPDVPIKFAGGGGVTFTHPVAQSDEGSLLYFSRSISPWRQSGGLQQPLNNSVNHPGDSVLLPGVRSDPRKIQQVSTTSAQMRSDDGHHTIDHHPTNGTTIKTVDPSTPVASPSFNPFLAATRFLAHFMHPTNGVLGQAVDGGTVHDHGITHADGPFMRAANALHSVLCHPQNGASLNAQNLLHSVAAGPLGAIMSAFGGKHTVSALASGLSLQSATAISLSCPAGGLSLPSGGVSAGSLAHGAASSNVGQLGGDLAGTLPSPAVVGIGNVDATSLPRAANDSAAAGAGVGLNRLYVNTGAVSGVGLLAVRLA